MEDDPSHSDPISDEFDTIVLAQSSSVAAISSPASSPDVLALEQSSARYGKKRARVPGGTVEAAQVRRSERIQKLKEMEEKS